MTEIRTPLIPISVDKVCECGEGRMRSNGMMLASIPALYPHHCNKCGKTENYHKSYPYITHEAAPDAN